MGFRKSQKENKYLTEIDPDEIKIGENDTTETDESLTEDKADEKPEAKESKGDGLLDAFDIPVKATPIREPSEQSTISAIREPSAEKEIKMVKDFRTNQTGAIQMKVARPKSLREATAVADSLMAGQTIVLNLDALTDGDAKRMLDYIAGVIFAIRGKIERPADRTFLLTPNGVNVATEEKTADSDEE